MLRTDEPQRAQGRPLGEVAEAVLSALTENPQTARQLAARLNCAIPIVEKTCYRLRTAGRLAVTGYIKIAGSNRPVALYEAVIEEPANMTLDQIYCGRGAR